MAREHAYLIKLDVHASAISVVCHSSLNEWWMCFRKLYFSDNLISMWFEDIWICVTSYNGTIILHTLHINAKQSAHSLGYVSLMVWQKAWAQSCAGLKKWIVASCSAPPTASECVFCEKFATLHKSMTFNVFCCSTFIPEYNGRGFGWRRNRRQRKQLAIAESLQLSSTAHSWRSTLWWWMCVVNGTECIISSAPMWRQCTAQKKKIQKKWKSSASHFANVPTWKKNIVAKVWHDEQTCRLYGGSHLYRHRSIRKYRIWSIKISVLAKAVLSRQHFNLIRDRRFHKIHCSTVVKRGFDLIYHCTLAGVKWSAPATSNGPTDRRDVVSVHVYPHWNAMLELCVKLSAARRHHHIHHLYYPIIFPFT